MIVGGLIFSQMVTLFVTPVIYLWLEWFQENVLDRVPFLRSGHTHHEGDMGAHGQRAGRCLTGIRACSLGNQGDFFCASALLEARVDSLAAVSEAHETVLDLDHV